MKVTKEDQLSYWVESDDGVKYLVWYSNDKFTCDCEGYQFYGLKPDFSCKHIKEVKALLKKS